MNGRSISHGRVKNVRKVLIEGSGYRIQNCVDLKIILKWIFNKWDGA
jgi:hypothetical protein